METFLGTSTGGAPIYTGPGGMGIPQSYIKTYDVPVVGKGANNIPAYIPEG